MAAVKTMEQRYRFYKSNDEFPDRKIFESRYFAVKYLKEFYPGYDNHKVLIQNDPFTREGFVIVFLEFVGYNKETIKQNKDFVCIEKI